MLFYTLLLFYTTTTTATITTTTTATITTTTTTTSTTTTTTSTYLHLAPDRCPRQYLTTQFYRPDGLPATQPTVSKH